MNGTVNEGDSFTVEAAFYDSTGAVALPASIRYQVWCKTNETTVRDWTNVGIGTEVTFSIVPSDNRILDTRNKFEQRQLVVQTNAGTDSQQTETMEWRVKNLGGVVV